jgi:transcriptional regulator CtsR
LARLSDSIEAHLMALLAAAEAAAIEVQRGDVARAFGCAPSQVTYVLGTRFTPERGFLVESRRGGGGYVRITRLASPGRLLREVLRATRDGIDQATAISFIGWLLREGLVSDREAAMLQAAMDHAVLSAAGWLGPERECLRGRLLRAMVVSLMVSDRAAPADSRP